MNEDKPWKGVTTMWYRASKIFNGRDPVTQEKYSTEALTRYCERIASIQKISIKQVYGCLLRAGENHKDGNAALTAALAILAAFAGWFGQAVFQSHDSAQIIDVGIGLLIVLFLTLLLYLLQENNKRKSNKLYEALCFLEQ